MPKPKSTGTCPEILKNGMVCGKPLFKDWDEPATACRLHHTLARKKRENIESEKSHIAEWDSLSVGEIILLRGSVSASDKYKSRVHLPYLWHFAKITEKSDKGAIAAPLCEKSTTTSQNPVTICWIVEPDESVICSDAITELELKPTGEVTADKVKLKAAYASTRAIRELGPVKVVATWEKWNGRPLSFSSSCD